MNKIASFQVDHTKLLPGIYVSRTDGNIITYDIRMRRPNIPPYISNPALHTIEHLFATLARNSKWKDHVLYFGPMGCRTGFYLLLKNLPEAEAIQLIQQVFEKISVWQGDIPGAAESECGNYLEHDLEEAKKEATAFLSFIKDWTPEKLVYCK